MGIDVVLKTVRQHLKHLGRPNMVKVPESGTGRIQYSWKDESERRRITARIPRRILEENMQRDDSAIATFLLCLAYWYEKASPGLPVECVLSVDSPADSARGVRLTHLRRSLFLIDQYKKLFPKRFVFDGPGLAWDWPTRPILNDPKNNRESGSTAMPKKRIRESRLERQITKGEGLLRGFPDKANPPVFFQRQFPVGLFEGRVDGNSHWTPGGNSQVDLWGTSKDGKVLHFVELKAAENQKTGIIPEAFYYARLLGYLRSGKKTAGTPEIQCQSDWSGYRAACAAERVIMWLSAPSFHPLLLVAGHSPLEWFNAALSAESIEMRILPFDLGVEGIERWGQERGWPSAS